MVIKQTTTPIEQAVIDKATALRKAKGMTQYELAEAIGVTQGFVGRVESGRFHDKYNLNHINELAKVFKCRPGDLLPNEAIEENKATS